MTAAYPDIDDSAPCRHGDVDRFFPHHNTTAQSAARVTAECLRCPFVAECRAYALDHLVQGIWGGTTDSERQSIRRKQHIVAEPLMVHSLVGVTHGPKPKRKAS